MVEDVEDRFFFITHGVEEIAKVIDEGTIFVSGIQRFVWQWIRLQIFNRGSCERAPIHENAEWKCLSLVSLNAV